MAGKISGFMRGRRLREMGRLLVIAFSLAIALLVYFRLFGTPFVDAIARWTAASAAQTLNALGTSVVNTGTIVGSSTFAYNVVAECTAIGPVILFAGTVLAYPATWRSRVVGISMGGAPICNQSGAPGQPVLHWGLFPQLSAHGPLSGLASGHHHLRHPAMAVVGR